MPKQFSQTQRLAPYHCDNRGRLALTSLFQLIIETSSKQSQLLGRDNDYVTQQGLTWVITHYQTSIKRLPKVGESVVITTEATAYNKYFCYRNFWLTDDQQNKIIEVKSTFVLMDIATRKMGAVNNDIIAPFESKKIKQIVRHKKIEQFTPNLAKEYLVRYSDIDLNLHVNNAKYIDMMVDVLGFDFLNTHFPTDISLRFDKEISYGETVQSVGTLYPTNDQSDHRMIVGNTLCAEAQIKWQKD